MTFKVVNAVDNAESEVRLFQHRVRSLNIDKAQKESAEQKAEQAKELISKAKALLMEI